MVEIRAPFLVNIDVTNRCNLKCSYCYNARNSKYPVDIDVEKCLNLITELFEVHGIFHMTIAGGEPLLHPGIFQIMKRGFAQYSPRISLLSNGTPLLRDNIFREFVSICQLLNDSGKRLKMQISLDSHLPQINDLQREKGSDVLTAIEKVLDLPVDLQLACVVTKYNIEFADQLVEAFYPRVKNYHYMNIMPSAGRSRGTTYREMAPDRTSIDDFHSRVLDLEKRFDPVRISKLFDDYGSGSKRGTIRGKGCLAGTTTIEIDPNLDVRACCMSTEVLGNLGNQTFVDLWYSDQAERIRNQSKPFCDFWKDEVIDSRKLCVYVHVNDGKLSSQRKSLVESKSGHPLQDGKVKVKME